jgi:hypothetical protein
MTNVVFVSAGLQSPKKGNAAVFKRQRYLNYGLLSLANSAAVQKGLVFHGHFDSPSETIQNIATAVDVTARTICLLSYPSFLSLNWAIEFVDKALEKFSDIKFVLGGRWVVDGNFDLIKRRLPSVDAVFEGIGEGKISKFLDEKLSFKYERDTRAREVFEETQLSYLDYTKLSDPLAFVPSFERSRGCGAGCMFCAEAAVKLTKLKPPALLCEEIAQYIEAIPSGPRRFYLETSNFTPLFDWIQQFIAERNDRGLEDVFWRTESRVDMFSQRNIEGLARAGLKVLDLGLESASPQQLIKMGKTKDPESYLARCARLIRAAADNGIMVKLNVLLYPGEDHGTVSETLGWLDAHHNYIQGVSAFPTVYYGLQPSTDPTAEQYRALGASLVEPAISDGIQNINLSPEIPYPDSEALARQISQRFMTADQYFTLKSFSYFDPRYTRDQFIADIGPTSQEVLTFTKKPWRSDQNKHIDFISSKIEWQLWFALLRYRCQLENTIKS